MHESAGPCVEALEIENETLRSLLSALQSDRLVLREQLSELPEEIDRHLRERARLSEQLAEIEDESRRIAAEYARVEEDSSRLAKLDGRPVGAIAIFRLLPQKAGFETVDYELFDLLATHGATALHCSGLQARLRGEGVARAPGLAGRAG